VVFVLSCIYLLSIPLGVAAGVFGLAFSFQPFLTLWQKLSFVAIKSASISFAVHLAVSLVRAMVKWGRLGGY
jgi:hypothetical protein